MAEGGGIGGCKLAPHLLEQIMTGLWSFVSLNQVSAASIELAQDGVVAEAGVRSCNQTRGHLANNNQSGPRLGRYPAAGGSGLCGYLRLCRVALQRKTRMECLQTPVYRLAPSHQARWSLLI